MNREQAIKKLAKLLALASSDNPHEAEAAMRQARALMQAHGLSEHDARQAHIREVESKARKGMRVAQWRHSLAQMVGVAFGCQVLWGVNRAARVGAFVFVGHGNRPELAEYTHAVLLRQLERARKGYLAECPYRRAATRRMRADLYAEGWIERVRGKVQAFATPSEAESQALDAYLGHVEGRAVARTTKAASSADIGAILEGHRAADGVSLLRPMQGDVRRQLEATQ